MHYRHESEFFFYIPFFEVAYLYQYGMERFLKCLLLMWNFIVNDFKRRMGWKFGYLDCWCKNKKKKYFTPAVEEE